HSIDDAGVPLRVAVRLGLIVNELVTNALKHAFGKEGGRISIGFTAGPSEGVLTVADDGRGMQGARPGNTPSDGPAEGVLTVADDGRGMQGARPGSSGTGQH